MKDKMTVTEFAEASGKSRQAIYKQIDKKLSPYVTTVDNVRMIDSAALEEVYGIKVESEETTESKQEDNWETTAKLLELFEEELKNKNKEIADLREKLDKSYQIIAEMGARSQYITAADKTALIVDHKKTEEEKRNKKKKKKDKKKRKKST